MKQDPKKVAWLSGKQVEGLKFLYNSIVKATSPDGTKKTGWIVAVVTDGHEPLYTVEADDGSGDIECPESAIETVTSSN
jgi:hypothetical protein